MSRGEAYIHDERREYLAHVLSRTKRKDYENYVVNAVWQRLADPPTCSPKPSVTCAATTATH